MFPTKFDRDQAKFCDRGIDVCMYQGYMSAAALANGSSSFPSGPVAAPADHPLLPRGVSRDSETGRFHAYIRNKAGRFSHLGTFDTAKEAAAKYELTLAESGGAARS